MFHVGRAGLLLVCALGAGAVAGAGCARSGGAGKLPGEGSLPVRLASHRIPAVPARRVSTLLDFERPEDLAFVRADPVDAVRLDGSAAREGAGSLAIAPGTRAMAIQLATLLAGRPFPADWTLIGAYFYADAPATVTLAYEAPGKPPATRTVAIGAGAWTPVMLDLVESGVAEPGVLHVKTSGPRGRTVRCDDVVLIDNHHAVVDAPSGPAPWSVKRRGLSYVVDAPGRFAFPLRTAESEQGGWWVAEACDARASFRSAALPSSLTVYPDGRAYCDGEFKSLAPALPDGDEIAQQHVSPAEMSIAPEMGRVVRTSPGDGDNDGYNESTGAYQLAAAGPRVEFTLAPRTPVLARPVIEIGGLPPGEVLVHMEGQLVPASHRLPNGNLLLELPARLARATQVNVRVQ